MKFSVVILLACTLFWGCKRSEFFLSVLLGVAARQSIEQKKVVKLKDLTDIGLMAVRP